MPRAVDITVTLRFDDGVEPMSEEYMREALEYEFACTVTSYEEEER